LTAARHEQGKSSGDSMDSMTLAQKRAVTFEEFWLIFQRHHRVDPNTMQTYFSTWVNHVRPYLRTSRIALFDATNAINSFTPLADPTATVNTRSIPAVATLSAFVLRHSGVWCFGIREVQAEPRPVQQREDGGCDIR
jgi:hypothetical protein